MERDSGVECRAKQERVIVVAVRQAVVYRVPRAEPES